MFLVSMNEGSTVMFLVSMNEGSTVMFLMSHLNEDWKRKTFIFIYAQFRILYLIFH